MLRALLHVPLLGAGWPQRRPLRPSLAPAAFSEQELQVGAGATALFLLEDKPEAGPLAPEVLVVKFCLAAARPFAGSCWL